MTKAFKQATFLQKGLSILLLFICLYISNSTEELILFKIFGLGVLTAMIFQKEHHREGVVLIAGIGAILFAYKIISTALGI